MVTGDSKEEVMNFLYTQLLHHNIYFIIVAQTIQQSHQNTTNFNVMNISFGFHWYSISDYFWHRHMVPRHNRHTSGMAFVRYIGYPPFWSFLSATLSLHQVPSAPLRPPRPPSGPLSPYPPYLRLSPLGLAWFLLHKILVLHLDS